MYQEYLNQLQQTIAPLGSEDLKELLNNDDKLDAKVDEVLQVLSAQKSSLFEENRHKAEINIEKEPQIIELRAKITELANEGRERCVAVQEQLTHIKEKSGAVSQETALALLQTSAAESEEQTESLVKTFTDNEVGVEVFLEEFLTQRKLMHLRKLKAEKMVEILRKQRQQQTQRGGIGSSATPYINDVTVSSGFYPHPPASGVPYPMMGPMMPMPPPQRPY